MKQTDIILIFAFALVLYIISAHIVYKKGAHHYKNNRGPLDSGFFMISDKRDNKALYKIKEVSYYAYILLFLLAIHKHKPVLLEWVLSWSIVFILRSILFVSTVLPDPSEQCKKFDIKNPHKGGCYDLVISAHSMTVFTSFFTLLNNNLLTETTLMILIPYYLFLIYSIISLRHHYTIDVVNALAYSYLVSDWVHGHISFNV